MADPAKNHNNLIGSVLLRLTPKLESIIRLLKSLKFRYYSEVIATSIQASGRYFLKLRMGCKMMF